ncbi:MAG TPA: DNA adenine methylase [bacterium]|nr:DNA adenine methylase [bacterium]
MIAFGWYGGKYNHLEWLLPLLPKCHHYCEPFGGSAAVLLNREPSPIETYNDIHGEVVNFFRVLRDQKERLKAYSYEMTDAEHKRLAEVLIQVKGKVALSGYRCPLTDQLYSSFRRIDAPTKKCHSSKAPRAEALWINYRVEQRNPRDYLTIETPRGAVPCEVILSRVLPVV